MNVYDFDKTIYKGDSTVDFWKFCLKRKPRIVFEIPKVAVWAVKYKLGVCSKEQLKEKFYGFLRYFSNIDDEVNGFWSVNNHKIKQWYLKQKREDDVIISASPEFILKPICEQLGVMLICSKVDRKTGKLLGKNCHGKEKIHRFREVFLNEEVDDFFSDSYSDQPMAELANKAYLVDGNKRMSWGTRLDVFDRLMKLPVLRIFEPFYLKYKEILLYIFFGGLTFLIGLITYFFFEIFCGINELIANIMSWILTVLFAFFTNRKWVFQIGTSSVKDFIKQMVCFYGGRVITLVIEEIILAIFITWKGFDSMVVKVIAQIIVIVLNYVISKLWVFNEG